MPYIVALQTLNDTNKSVMNNIMSLAPSHTVLNLILKEVSNLYKGSYHSLPFLSKSLIHFFHLLSYIFPIFIKAINSKLTLSFISLRRVAVISSLLIKVYTSVTETIKNIYFTANWPNLSLSTMSQQKEYNPFKPLLTLDLEHSPDFMLLYQGAEAVCLFVLIDKLT